MGELVAAARGEILTQISNSTKTIAAGVPTTRSARQCAQLAGIETPIISEIFSILYEDAKPAQAMHRLLARDPRPECDSL